MWSTSVGFPHVWDRTQPRSSCRSQQDPSQPQYEVGSQVDFVLPSYGAASPCFPNLHAVSSVCTFPLVKIPYPFFSVRPKCLFFHEDSFFPQVRIVIDPLQPSAYNSVVTFVPSCHVFVNVMYLCFHQSY